MSNRKTSRRKPNKLQNQNNQNKIINEVYSNIRTLNIWNLLRNNISSIDDNNKEELEKLPLNDLIGKFLEKNIWITDRRYSDDKFKLTIYLFKDEELLDKLDIDYKIEFEKLGFNIKITEDSEVVKEDEILPNLPKVDEH